MEKIKITFFIALVFVVFSNTSLLSMQKHKSKEKSLTIETKPENFIKDPIKSKKDNTSFLNSMYKCIRPCTLYIMREHLNPFLKSCQKVNWSYIFSTIPYSHHSQNFRNQYYK